MSKNIFEDQLRSVLSEEFSDVNPPENFTQNVMSQLPKKTSNSVTLSKKIEQLSRCIWNIFTRPMTVSASPLQILASAAVIFCGVFVLANMSLDNMESRHSGLQPTLTTSSLKRVAFALPDPDRKFSSAVVIGSFNKWQSQGFEMHYDESQEAWVLEHALASGDYEYVFLVNGESSMPDPRAVFYVQDSFGNKNSLLQVSGVQHEL